MKARLPLLAFTLLAAFPCAAADAQANDQAPPTWNLAAQYPNEAAWNGAVAELDHRLAAFARRRGAAISRASQLADLLDEVRFLRGRAGNLARYALLTSFMDTNDTNAKARLDGATAMEARVEAGVSWVDGATSALGRSRLEAWRRDAPRLSHHGWEINAAILGAGHAYPRGSEAAFAGLERARLTATVAYDALMQADLAWPEVAGENGARVRLDPQAFGDLSASRDTNIRRAAAETFYARLKPLEPALGLLLTRRLEVDHALAVARHFDNGNDGFFVLGDGMPAGAYRVMLDNVRANRAVFARYARTVARLNHLSDLRYADLSVLAPAYSRPIPLAEAQDIAVAAAAPMGADYQSRLRQRLSQPWFDLVPRAHKDGGALGVYWPVGGGPPYGIMSYRPNLAGARTIAAIAALTMFYADLPADKAPVRREDDFHVYGNGLWFAASLQQVDHLLAQAPSREERIALLAGDLRRLWSDYLAGIIVTDFEDRLESAVAAGRPPAGAQISQLYLDVLRDYYRESGIRFTDADGEEWMTLPNMFYGHVWDEWAFAMAGAVAMTERVEAHDPAAIAAIAAPMSRPGSYSSYDMLRDAGANPANPAIYQAVIRRMNADMDRLDRELD